MSALACSPSRWRPSIHHSSERPGARGPCHEPQCGRDMPADIQQQRMLERLRVAGETPVTFAELRGGEIDFPAAVMGELELNGYASTNAAPQTHLGERSKGESALVNASRPLVVLPTMPRRPTHSREQSQAQIALANAFGGRCLEDTTPCGSRHRPEHWAHSDRTSALYDRPHALSTEHSDSPRRP